MSEVWKTVSINPLYEVSNLGRVRVLPHETQQVNQHGNIMTVHYKGKVLKPIIDSRGYLTVCINRKPKTIHRLVAIAFLPNPDNLPMVNHKDENPKNNRVENLEWCTEKYNLFYGTRLARIGKHFWVPVIGTDKDGKEHYFSSMREAENKTGVNQRNISGCCRGVKNRPTAGGYKWRYA